MEEQQYAATNIVCLHQPSTQSYTETIKKNYIYFKKIQNPINWKKNMALMLGTQCNEFDNLRVKFEMTTLIRKKLWGGQTSIHGALCNWLNSLNVFTMW